ncbi:hypothetical protein EV175_001757 [Coemansia sp. RSA 1933]|nr:hypothetical protein EV175_001757 [Coemansia sp. RSA 1933]
MSSVATDDLYQDIEHSQLQEPGATQPDAAVFSHDEMDDESLAKKTSHAEASLSQFPDDVPMLRSCENCRRKKRKCSGDKPTCTRCGAQGEACTYRPTARYFKPRANGTAGFGSSHRLGNASKKRASMDHVSSAGGSGMVTKARFHHSGSNNSGFGGLDGGRRQRAMSTVTAAHMSSMNGSSQGMMQQRMSAAAGVTALAPADLMLSPAVAGCAVQTDIIPSPSTPSSMQPGSAPCLRQFGDIPSQQYLQMQQQSKMAFGNVNGLAYMMPPVGGDEDATASSSTYYTSPSTNSTPPQLLLNMDFSFAQPSSTAQQQQPLLTSMAMSMNSEATVTSPLLGSKLQQHSMYPPVAGLVSDASAANRVVSSPQPIFSDGDYVNLFANSLKGQQSAALMMKTPMASASYTPGTSGSLMYSPPPPAASAMASYPLCSSATSVAAAAAVMAMATANGSNGTNGLWSHIPSANDNTTAGGSAMMSPNSLTAPSSLGLQQTYQPSIAVGPMDLCMEYAAAPGSTAVGSVMSGAIGGGVGGLDFILPQNKNLFSEWLA